MTKEQPKREWVARGFTAVEDIVYLGLGLLPGWHFSHFVSERSD